MKWSLCSVLTKYWSFQKINNQVIGLREKGDSQVRISATWKRFSKKGWKLKTNWGIKTLSIFFIAKGKFQTKRCSFYRINSTQIYISSCLILCLSTRNRKYAIHKIVRNRNSFTFWIKLRRKTPQLGANYKEMVKKLNRFWEITLTVTENREVV